MADSSFGGLVAQHAFPHGQLFLHQVLQQQQKVSGLEQSQQGPSSQHCSSSRMITQQLFSADSDSDSSSESASQLLHIEPVDDAVEHVEHVSLSGWRVMAASCCCCCRFRALLAG